MSTEDIELLHVKLDGLEEHLSLLESKEDRLQRALDEVQRKLDAPSVVTPRFSKRVAVVAGSLMGVWTIGLGVIIVTLLMR